MVHVTTPRPSIGAAIGQGLGQGLNEAMQYQINRGRLQNALKEASSISQQPNANPLEVTNAYLSAFAGIPGSEKYVGALLPQILKMAQTQQIIPGSQGAGQQQNIPQGMQQTQQQIPISTPTNGLGQAGKPASANVEGLPQAQAPTTGGVLPQIMSPEEINARAEHNTSVEQNPDRLPFWQTYYNNQNEIARKALTDAEATATKLGIPSNELPEFMQLGQRYGYMRNLNDWGEATKRDYEEYKESINRLQAAFIPKFWSGLVSNAKTREKTLDNLTGSVQDLVKLGKEPQTRQFLASEGLSPTEIEGLVHPISKQQKSNLEKVPRGLFPLNRPEDYDPFLPPKSTFKTYEEISEKNPKAIQRLNTGLSNFFKDNVNNDTSLLVLTNKLIEDKDYDWRQVGPAIREAMAKGLKLNIAQQNELTKIETQPPIQSLSNIFRDWGRWIDYLRGNK